MGRRITLVLAALAALTMLASACDSGGGAANDAPATTRATTTTLPVATGPLAPVLLTQTQIRQVPGLSSAKVSAVAGLTIFDEPDPRGPCGEKVPKLPLTGDAVGMGFTAELIRGGLQLVTRFPAGGAKQYLDARMANSIVGCQEFAVPNRQGTTQRMQLVRIVRLYSEFEQALAVVMAVNVGGIVRATTELEVRRGDVVSRVVVYTNRPLGNASVRGIVSVMAQNLELLPE